MTEDRIEAGIRNGAGRVQDAAGGLLGDDKLQLKGKLNEAAGTLQDTYGQVKDQASDLLEQAQDVLADAETFIREQPFAAAAIGVGVGLVFGILLRGGRRTVYVRK